MNKGRQRPRGSGGRGAVLGGSRGETVRVKTAGKRRPSSTRWLERQLNDPYVAEAKRLGYRSRAAFKLLQLDDRFHVLAKGKRVVDLGAAPGGWTQVAVERVQAPLGGRVVAIDLQEMEPIPGAVLLQMDGTTAEASARAKQELGGGADVVLSDMAPAATGHQQTDHLRIMGLAESAFETARELLEPGGAFIVKVWQGGAQKELLDVLKREFETVRHVKPPASRADSAELYLVALGFRGRRHN
ncbi:MAG TPA: RlmE family RNA methyltransferase [Dongiaceae bacterium]|jgi:23S rRNA (uridine2552-2'-O)-methyltransferase